MAGAGGAGERRRAGAPASAPPTGSGRRPAAAAWASLAPGSPPPGSPARHCWVTTPVDGPTPRPGLLLEWRRVGRGRWEGRVVYAAELRPGRWAAVEEWVPAELLAAR